MLHELQTLRKIMIDKFKNCCIIRNLIKQHRGFKMSDITTRQVGPKGAKKAIRKAFKLKRPIFVWGGVGCGKSDVVKQLGEETGSLVIDARLSMWDPTDLKGMPYFDPETKTMAWAPPVELPSEETAARYPSVILFLDEMNSAPPSVQAAAYQLVLNRRVGTYTLPDNVLIVAAGNREADKGVTYRMPAPLANRFTHIELTVKWDDYFEWATENKIRRDVLGFLTFSKKDLADFDSKSSSRAFATPRSWSYVSDFVYDDDDDHDNVTLTDLIAGSVGDGLAIKFMAHRKMASKLPNPSDILSGKVSKMETKELSAMYSLAISLCYELKDAHDANVDDWDSQTNNFFKFIMNNFETEIVIMATRLGLTQYNLPFDPDEIECFEEFHSKYSKYISHATANK